MGTRHIPWNVRLASILTGKDYARPIERPCPQCGTALRVGSRYCSSCGVELRWVVKPTKPARIV